MKILLTVLRRKGRRLTKTPAVEATVCLNEYDKRAVAFAVDETHILADMWRTELWMISKDGFFLRGFEWSGIDDAPAYLQEWYLRPVEGYGKDAK